ncbi:hypothetical protein [Nodularia sphaerocarpa]|nr:hypothetical protein [Nodularia sphaerocarpa]MDB9371869.1 hypothetical protein [Nodularia sphaerocarpa CS-585]MDB9380435.1 hypothetical protein [Nodularia sphaerocarpa CS-585A2]
MNRRRAKITLVFSYFPFPRRNKLDAIAGGGALPIAVPHLVILLITGVLK